MAAFFRNRLLLLSFFISISIHLIVLGASPALRILASKKKKDKYLEVFFYPAKLPEIQPEQIKIPKITSSVYVKNKDKKKEQIKKAQAKKIIKPPPEKEVEKEESRKTLEKAKKEFASQIVLVRQYQKQLNSIIAEITLDCFPEEAKKRELVSGELTILFYLNKKGRVTFIEVIRTTDEVFSPAAIAVLKEASKLFPKFPKEIDQSEIGFNTNIVFEIKQ